MTIDDVRTVFENKSPQEVLIKGLQQYLNTEESDFEILKSQFDNLEYKNITEPISYFEESISDIINNWNEYEWLYNLLQDENSRTTLCLMLMAKLTLDTTFIEKAFSEEPIYFSKQIWGHLSQETYLDCGAFDGDTVESFVLSCPDYVKIYAFEPVPEVMRLCKNNLQDLYNLENSNIIYMEYATSDIQGEVCFDVGTMNGESKQSETGSIKCKCMPIDLINDNNVSLIKMDIEGAEAAAIEGAKNIIANNTPKMAICIYHKPGDFWRIPHLILNINSNYHFVIRHHDYEVYSETVLYCVPTLSKDFVMENSSIALDRLRVVIDKVNSLTKAEYQNLFQHGKDKKWYLSQLRNQNNRIIELDSWITELEKARAYDEAQIKSKDERISELESWTSELEKARAYDEAQIKSKDERISELESWTTEQENAKQWLLSEIQYRDSRIKELDAQLNRERILFGESDNNRTTCAPVYQNEDNVNELFWLKDRIKGFDHIVSLGYNCEVSFRIEDYQQEKLDSYPLSWAYVKDQDDLTNALEHLDETAKETIREYVPGSGMFNINELNIDVHTTVDKSLVPTYDDAQFYSFVEEASAEISKRFNYLNQKWVSLLNGDESTLFLLKLQSWKSVESCYEVILSVNHWLYNNYKSRKYLLACFTDKDDVFDYLCCKEIAGFSPHITITKIGRFATDDNTHDGGDINSWLKAIEKWDHLASIDEPYYNVESN